MDARRGTAVGRLARPAWTRLLLTLTALVLLALPGNAGTVGRLAGGAAIMAAALATWRAGRPVRGDPTQPWTWFAASSGLVATGTILDGALLLAAGGSASMVHVSDVADSAWRVAGLLLTYQGIVRWNRMRDGIATPQDWVNGLGAVLGLTALLAVLLAHGDQWPEPLEVGEIAAAVVVCATAATISGLASLRRDARLAWVVGGVALLAAAELVEAFAPEAEALPIAAWVVAALMTGRAALMPPPASRYLRPASARATTFGSAFVAVFGLATIGLYHPTLATADGWILIHEDGPAWPVLAAAAAALGGVVKLGALARDRAMLASSSREARTDELTGVGNRRALLEHLRRLGERGRTCALLLIDLDDFKSINDRHGHLAGDDVLRGAARALVRATGPDALVVRTGGDEFAVVADLEGPALDAMTAAVVEALAQVTTPTTPALRDAVLGRHADAAPLQAPRAGLGASIGTASGPADADRLLHRADIAMYEAKMSGRAVVRYDDALGASLAERRLLGDELRALLTGADRSALEVWYQPQLDATHGTLVGVEALVRWAHPRLGRLLPDAFLDLVEEQGLMVALTEHVLSTATRDARTWLDVGVRLRVSINLAPEVLASDNASELVLSVIEASGLDPRSVVLEVTESALIPGDSVAFAHAVALASHGLALSIDDYGTGYSSLAQLHHVPAAELKLDRALTRDLRTDRRATVIAAATIELAHRLGIRVVAEGVEETATLELLATLGCDEVQGWVHAPAMPADALLAWALEHRPTRPTRLAVPDAPPTVASSR